jgi:hypothetical protein
LEHGSDAWCLANWAPEVGIVVLDEQIPREQGQLDGEAQGTEDAVAAYGGEQREVGDVALTLEVVTCPALGLWLGVADAPIAAARRVVPSVERVRVTDIY